MTEQNPVLSVSGKTLEYYDRIFMKWIVPRICYAYWDVQNDCETYDCWPEYVKMEAFTERAWNENFEDDICANIIYSNY